MTLERLGHVGAFVAVIATSGAIALLVALAAGLAPSPSYATEAAGAADAAGETPGLDLVCPLELHERERDLADSRIEKTLTENQHRAQARVFEMIERLWATRAIEQEVYLDQKRLRDRTKVRITRLGLQIEQDRRALDQLELACADVRGEPVEDLAQRVRSLQSEVRRLDCDLLAKDAEIADIDRAFDEEMLAATKILVERNIKSRHDLVLDEYALSQSKARSESYRARARACRSRLEQARR